jgi:hypothetical protein
MERLKRIDEIHYLTAQHGMAGCELKPTARHGTARHGKQAPSYNY